MLGRIRAAMRVRGRARHPRRLLRRRLHARRPGLLRRGLRGGGRGRARRRWSSSTRSGSRRRRPSPSASGRTVERLDVPVHFHGHDDFGLATASAVAAVRAGASWVHGTVNGMGERAGNADLAEVALALRALYGVESNLRLDRARARVAPRARDRRLRPRAVEARRRRHALPARERRGREPVPRPALDRAVLVRARRRPSAASSWGRRAGSTRSGSRRPSSVSS